MMWGPNFALNSMMSSGAAPMTIGLPDAPGIPWLRIVLALLFCLAVSVAAILGLRHFKDGKGARSLFSGLHGLAMPNEIEIVETRRASPHAHVCLIHYRDHAYLIATTPNSASVIDKMLLPDRKEGDA